MITAIALAIYAAPVTFAAPAAQLSRLLPEVGKSLRLKLEAAPTLANEVILINVRQVDKDALLSKIAEVSIGTWEKRGATLVLNRTDAQVRKLNAESLDAMAQTFREEINKKLASQKPMGEKEFRDLTRSFGDLPTGDQRYRRQYELLAGTPISRLAIRIAGKLDLKRVALLQPEERLVFSSKPNRLQLPFLGSVSTEVASFLKEQELWERQAPNFPTNNSNGGLYELQMSARPIGQLDRVLVSVRNYGGGSVQLEVRIYDVKGKRGPQGSLQLAGDTDYNKFQKLLETKKPKNLELTLTPVTSALLEAGKRRLKPQRVTFPADVREILQWPEKNEPLAYGISELLSAYAPSQNWNLVINVPDILMAMAGGGIGVETPSPQLALGMLQFFGRLSEMDGWVTLQPKNLIQPQYARTSRSAIGTFLRAANGSGPASLEAAAALSVATPDLQMFYGVQVIASAIAGQEDNDPRLVGVYDLLKFYGSMTAVQISAAKSQQGVELGQLTPHQQRLIALIAFKEPYSIQIDYSSESQNKLGMAGMQALSEMQEEPTDLAPDGLQPKQRLTLKESSSDAVFITFKPGEYPRKPERIQAQSLGWYMTAADSPAQNPWIAQMGYDFDRFHQGSSRTLTFGLKVMEYASYRGVLNDDRPSLVASKYSELPQKFREAVEKSRAEYKESMAKGQAGAPATRQDPPPPRF
jgi:hypothetical protein